MAETASPGRVLLVDDDEMDRFLVGLALSSAGYDVCEAESAESAMQFCATSHPDAVVVDYLMPGMDGLELCRRLREHPSSRGLPIVMLSGLEDPTLAERAREAGADDLVPKSTNPYLLLAQLDKAIHARPRAP